MFFRSAGALQLDGRCLALQKQHRVGVITKFDASGGDPGLFGEPGDGGDLGEAGGLVLRAACGSGVRAFFANGRLDPAWVSALKAE